MPEFKDFGRRRIQIVGKVIKMIQLCVPEISRQKQIPPDSVDINRLNFLPFTRHSAPEYLRMPDYRVCCTLIV